MGWLSWFGAKQPELTDPISRRLARWADLPGPNLNIPLDTVRLTVIDIETTGLDPARHEVLSVGAVAIQGPALHLGESFHCQIALAGSGSYENVLIHGIAPSQWAQGTSPASCLTELLEFCGKEMLLAFHAPFDRAFLTRAAKRRLGVRFRNRFLDVAWLLKALFPSALGPRAGLDDWCAHFGVHNSRRHTADADAFATAELVLVALAEARRKQVPSLKALVRLVHHTERLAPAGVGGSG